MKRFFNIFFSWRALAMYSLTLANFMLFMAFRLGPAFVDIRYGMYLSSIIAAVLSLQEDRS